MIFVMAANEPTVFLMLAESDVKTMREGRTTFVDQRQLQGHTFNRVVLSLHRSDTEALETIRQAGHRVEQLAVPEPGPKERRCTGGCNGIVATKLLFEDRCAPCWAQLAKSLQTGSN